MITFLLDLGLYTSHFILSKMYNGAYSLIWGKPKNPLLLKMDEIGKTLEHLNFLNSKNAQFYWTIKHKLKHNSWVIIHNEKILFETDTKNKALLYISGWYSNNTRDKVLLVQVGHENNMCEI